MSKADVSRRVRLLADIETSAYKSNIFASDDSLIQYCSSEAAVV